MALLSQLKSPKRNSIAGGAVLGAALLSGWMAAAPAKAITLLDNTYSPAQATTALSGSIGVNSQNRIAFNIGATGPASYYVVRSITTNFIAFGNFSNLQLRILEGNLDTSGPGNNEIASPQSFSLTGSGPSPANYTFAINPVNLTPGSNYTFEFSSSDSAAAFWSGSDQQFSSNGLTFNSYASTSNFGASGETWAVNTSGNPYLRIEGDAVPGPLPLLGAGTAFAWSRRLRRRLQQQPGSCSHAPKASA